MKRSPPRRDWSRARTKLEAEGACRVCGSPNVEAAHVIGRVHDPAKDCGRCHAGWLSYGRGSCPYCDGSGKTEGRVVLPEAIVPLCGSPTFHHMLYDSHRLDLLPYLTLDEQCRAVRDAGGLVAAYERTTGNQWKAEAA